MPDLPHSLLEEYKTQASILYKQLRADDPLLARESAIRFQRLPYLHDISLNDIATSIDIKRKHALAVIALENDYETWAIFKRHLKRKDYLSQRREAYFTLLYPHRCAGYVLEWHSDYDTASRELGRNGGYLLPYKHQFFICEGEYITELGLNPDDADWARIGYNWVKPADQRAWQRLNDKLTSIEGEGENA